MIVNYSEMSEEEFMNAIAEKYGEEWTVEQIAQDKDIYSEYLRRLGTGHFE